MDTHDVSDVPQYLEVLLKQKRRLQNAKSQQGKHPRTRKTRDEVIEQFNIKLMMNVMRGVSHDDNTIKSSFIPPAYLPCHNPFDLLTKILIKDLLLETHHRGTYLLLRSVTGADRINALMAIMEDEYQDVIMIQLYHQRNDNEHGEEEILREGSVLAIKEPYFKLMSDGNYGLRADHLSDIIFLSAYDERVPKSWQQSGGQHDDTAVGWKIAGNNYFNVSKYHAAIQSYTKGLTFSSTEDEADVLRRNRSLAFIKTKQFDAALRDLEYPSSTIKPVEKALYRRAQALYSLRKYPECCEVLKILRIEYPNNTEVEHEFNRAADRIKELETGTYPFKKLHRQALKLQPPQLDHATYVGPLRIKGSGSRGRGLFTTEAVRAGDLLLCEKAFAYAFAEEGSNNVALLINVETDSMTMGAQAELLQLIVQKLYRNPSLAPIINNLHHGSYKPANVSEIDGGLVVDTFLIERIISLNCFGCPRLSQKSHLQSQLRAGIYDKQTKNEHHSCGVWPIASYINHSCFSNARRAFIGDIMTVRATQDLAADTEITFWYKSPADESYAERQKGFGHWGFKCDCIMCQDTQSTNQSAFSERSKLRAKGLKYYDPIRGITDTTKFEIIVQKMEDTYTRPASEVPRLSMWDPLLALAKSYMGNGQLVEAINSALKALESLGHVIEGGSMPRASGKPVLIKKWGLMHNCIVDCWMLLSNAYALVALELKDIAEQYARISYKICVGEDETFNETYKVPKP